MVREISQMLAPGQVRRYYASNMIYLPYMFFGGWKAATPAKEIAAVDALEFQYHLCNLGGGFDSLGALPFIKPDMSRSARLYDLAAWTTAAKATKFSAKCIAYLSGSISMQAALNRGATPTDLSKGTHPLLDLKNAQVRQNICTSCSGLMNLTQIDGIHIDFENICHKYDPGFWNTATSTQDKDSYAIPNADQLPMLLAEIRKKLGSSAHMSVAVPLIYEYPFSEWVADVNSPHGGYWAGYGSNAAYDQRTSSYIAQLAAHVNAILVMCYDTGRLFAYEGSDSFRRYLTQQKDLENGTQFYARLVRQSLSFHASAVVPSTHPGCEVVAVQPAYSDRDGGKLYGNQYPAQGKSYKQHDSQWENIETCSQAIKTSQGSPSGAAVYIWVDDASYVPPMGLRDAKTGKSTQADWNKCWLRG